ncbi:MAG: hypothetical protein AVDCRST_MAG72-55, partial [uncultured Nocardioidaceae bacterium]
ERDVHPGRRAGQAVAGADAAAARVHHPLSAVSPRLLGTQQRRTGIGDQDPRLSDRLLPGVLHRRAVRPGSAVRHDGRRHRCGQGRADRFRLPARTDADPWKRAAVRPACRRARCLVVLLPDLPGRGAGGRCDLRVRPARDGGDHGAGHLDRHCAVVDRGDARHAQRLRGSSAGHVPAVLRLPVPLQPDHAEAADRAGLVPHDRHVQPGLLPAGGDPVPGDHRVGWSCAGAGFRHRHRAGGCLRLRRLPRRADEVDTHM